MRVYVCMCVSVWVYMCVAFVYSVQFFNRGFLRLSYSLLSGSALWWRVIIKQARHDWSTAISEVVAFDVPGNRSSALMYTLVSTVSRSLSPPPPGLGQPVTVWCPRCVQPCQRHSIKSLFSEMTPLQANVRVRYDCDRALSWTCTLGTLSFHFDGTTVG